jgi:hypothetical protein
MHGSDARETGRKDEDTCMSYEDEDTCMSYESDARMRIHACHMRAMQG